MTLRLSTLRNLTMKRETYTIYSEREGTRALFLRGVNGADALVAAERLRKSGNVPVVYSERDNQRIYC